MPQGAPCSEHTRLPTLRRDVSGKDGRHTVVAGCRLTVRQDAQRGRSRLSKQARQ